MRGLAQRWWNLLVGVGVEPGPRTSGRRHILFLNGIVVLVLVLIVGTFVVTASFYPATRSILPIVIAHFVLISATLYWNAKRRYLLARVWFGLAAALFLTLFSIALGRESYWELFLAVCIFVNFYIFPVEERPWMVLVIVVCSLCFIGAHYLVPARGLLPDLPRSYLDLIAVFNVFGFLFCAVGMGTVGYLAVTRAERNLSAEYERSERLLHNILPVAVAQRLKDGEETIADGHDSATVMFLDLVSFTPLAAANSPADVVEFLSRLFGQIDRMVEHHRAEKIETAGDGYIAVAGLTDSSRDHAITVAGLALDIRAHFAGGVHLRDRRVECRIGLNSGPLTAGVIGRKKIAYKVWGDTVNMASRMESHGVPGQIQVSEATYQLIRHAFQCQPRGTVDVKGKGPHMTYWLEGRRSLANGPPVRQPETGQQT
jgi:adenylate cyclase